MATVKPFYCIRPEKGVAAQVAALPYDVYNREEALEQVKQQPLSFLSIDRAETQFPPSVGMYEPCVYQKARELLAQRIAQGIFVKDTRPCYYVYRLIMDGRAQTGIVACASVDDYLNEVIKKHEKTREEKEQDRICHVDMTDAHTGPIFLTYRANDVITEVVAQESAKSPLYDFVSPDGVTHQVWCVEQEASVSRLQEAFAGIDSVYIADGHHRAASAVKVALKRRQENPAYTGEEGYNQFLSVLFPHDQLAILPYNRVVKDLNGLSNEQFLQRVGQDFTVKPLGQSAFAPEKKGEFGLFLDGQWYALRVKENMEKEQDPVKRLDVSLLQDLLLSPVLGIGDPRTDKRIDFVGGIRGLGELEKRCQSDMKVAFSMYPTSIEELLSVADAGLLMPPKSTWFEPKLRSGLFIHPLT